MGNRSRKVYRARTTAGEDETIALNATPPWNSTLIQIGIHYDSPVSALASFIITKVSVENAVYNLNIYTDDPSIDGKTSDIFLCDIEFLKGDSVSAVYSNPDDIDVGLELIFREGQ